MGRLFGGLPAHNFEASDPKKQAELYGDWIYLRQVSVGSALLSLL